MRILITAGNTQVPIDKVRCLTNIFTGGTGARLAWHGHQCGHHVTLLTSHPEVVAACAGAGPVPGDRWTVKSYRTFEDLQTLLAGSIRSDKFDAIIHCAAVSDYLATGTYAPVKGTAFDAKTGEWKNARPEPPRLADRSAGKIKSDEPELWLWLVRAPKLIDRMRADWGFTGILVKFKLEVGCADKQLLERAEQSRQHSAADLMVANTLEGMNDWAFLGPIDGKYERVSRPDLAARLFEVLERCDKEREHG
jgi:phosphopantothenoylcysteine synthetase/decarboxylase